MSSHSTTLPAPPDSIPSPADTSDLPPILADLTDHVVGLERIFGHELVPNRRNVRRHPPEQQRVIEAALKHIAEHPTRDRVWFTRPGEIAAYARSLPKGVIAGSAGGVTGPVQADATSAVYLDVRLAQGTQADLAIPAGHNAFIYVYEGQAKIGDGNRGELLRGDLAVLDQGDNVRVAAPEAAARMIVVAGRPFNEPVAKYGPFVMNTQQQIVQAIEDFRSGRF